MNVIIVGAGISGLAAAISLRRSGHRVTIYERSSLNNEVGAAINVPPNASRVLLRWGLDPVEYRFVSTKGIYFMSPITMEELLYHDLSHSEELYGAPLLYAHRVDLHEGLKRMATEQCGPGVPAMVNLGSAVSSYNANTPSITLQDGTIITADLVVAADGVHSNAVEAILGKTASPQPANRMNCCYRFLIPRAEIETDPATRDFNHAPQQCGCRVFSDLPGLRRLITYSCRNYEMHNFVAICYNEDILSDRKEDWHAAIVKSEVLDKFAGFHLELLAVINKAIEVKRWPLLYRPPIPTWCKGKLVLVGDAAHPMLPHHAQSGAQGIEDGLAIGLVMHGVTDPSQINERLAIYEKVRRNRAASIQMLSNFTFDEKLPVEIGEFLEGKPAPESIHEMIELAYVPDVVQRTAELMTEIDPSFKLPEGFFPKEVVDVKASGNGSASEV